jgi:hypothetical protein
VDDFLLIKEKKSSRQSLVDSPSKPPRGQSFASRSDLGLILSLLNDHPYLFKVARDRQLLQTRQGLDAGLA